eukprot:TRINITY_DN39_c0_g1_i2.p1 TRINITY_DN39_c0_g1~~TRINITY_DN39_c0_g1_i2.p1  ORF type:complete len:1155 (-),score=403.16 TRINITY_DN39_c0_g1_i2:144-3608(-)
MSDKAAEAEWIRIQSKTFRNWCNTHLKHRMMSINDLRSDLSTGIPLINLVEIISSKTVNNGRWNKNPKVRTQMMENAGFALQFLKTEGLKLVNIGNEDIVDNNHKLILGLIWTIILRYQINISEGKSARSELLAWVRSKIPEKGIKNFDHDWNDGTAICALIEALKQGLIPDAASLDPANALANATRGCETAEKDMGISQVLAPEDMINPEVDELSVMTYIALFKEWEDKQASLKDTADPSRSTVHGPGVEGPATRGQPAPFTITAKNCFGGVLPKGGENYTVAVESAKGKKAPVTLKDNGDGTYDGVYTPEDFGPHTITVTAAPHGAQVGKSPYHLDIDAGVDASKSTVTGPGVEPHSVAQGHPTTFTVKAHDKDGNQVPATGAPFKATLNTPSGPKDLPLKDNGDGTYTGEYTPTDLGHHDVHVTLEGDHVAQSPYPVEVKELSDPSKTKVHGPGIAPSIPEGVPTKVHIEAVSPSGDKIKTGGDKFDVNVKGPNGTTPAKVHDNGDGTYTAEYTPEGKGKATVEVENTGPNGVQHVAQSPYHVQFRDPADPSKTKVTGPGVVSGVPQGIPTKVFVEARDANGNPVGAGGDQFDFKVNGPNGEVPSHFTDNGDGTYTGEYTPTDLGELQVDVKVNGDHHVADSSYKVVVREPADASKSKVTGPGVVSGVPQGVPTHVDIEARDRNGNPVGVGGDYFTFKVNGPNGEVPSTLKDNGDGTYHAEYTPTDLGELQVDVKVNGDHHVADSSYKVVVREPADASKSKVTGPGVVSGVPQGVPTHVDIEARDRNGNPVGVGGDYFTFKVNGPNGEVPSTLKDNGDGTYHAEYTPTDLGELQVDVKVNGDNHVADSTYNVVVREAADASKSKVWGRGVKDGVAENVETHFKIKAVDANGKDVVFGGDNFEVKVTGPNGNVPATVEDKKDGSYLAKYTATEVGPHTVEVVLRDQQVASSPYSVNVRERADHSKSTAEGPGLVHPTQNVPTHFKVTAFDRDGKKVPYGGDDVQVTMKGPEGEVPVTLTDNEDGTYLAEYTPLALGPHEIVVLMNGGHVAKSPYHVDVEEEADADESGLEGFVFTIQARDKSGASKQRGGDRFAVKIFTADAEHEPIEGVNIKDCGTGRYKVAYKLPGSGEYNVHITLNNRHIKGSPWRQVV